MFMSVITIIIGKTSWKGKILNYYPSQDNNKDNDEEKGRNSPNKRNKIRDDAEICCVLCDINFANIMSLVLAHPGEISMPDAARNSKEKCKRCNPA